MDELRRIDLNMLLTLHALLAEKHVTRAALRLHKSQPAVSHALAQLRNHFNDALLVRHGGTLVLTARAQALQVPLSEALGLLNTLLSVRDFDPATAHRRFRIAMSDYAARVIMSPVMKEIRKKAPGMEIAISQANRETMLAQLIDGEVDMGFGVFPAPPTDVRVKTLFVEELLSVAEKSTVPQGTALTLEEWLAYPHVMMAMRPDAQDEIEVALSKRGQKRNIVVASPFWGSTLEMVSGTDMILTAASRAFKNVDHYPTLHVFKPPLELPMIPYQQAWHARRDSDPAHQWLRETIESICGSLVN